jgi:hypothetical protein
MPPDRLCSWSAPVPISAPLPAAFTRLHPEGYWTSRFTPGVKRHQNPSARFNGLTRTRLVEAMLKRLIASTLEDALIEFLTGPDLFSVETKTIHKITRIRTNETASLRVILWIALLFKKRSKKTGHHSSLPKLSEKLNPT